MDLFFIIYEMDIYGYMLGAFIIIVLLLLVGSPIVYVFHLLWGVSVITVFQNKIKSNSSDILTYKVVTKIVSIKGPYGGYWYKHGREPIKYYCLVEFEDPKGKMRISKLKLFEEKISKELISQLLDISHNEGSRLNFIGYESSEVHDKKLSLIKNRMENYIPSHLTVKQDKSNMSLVDIENPFDCLQDNESYVPSRSGLSLIQSMILLVVITGIIINYYMSKINVY